MPIYRASRPCVLHLLLAGLLPAMAAGAQMSETFLLEDVNRDVDDPLAVEAYFELEQATVVFYENGGVGSTDGTPEGTVRLTTFLGDTVPIGVTPDRERVMFVGGFFEADLWMTDGTVDGTKRLTTEGDVLRSSGSTFMTSSGKVFFVRGGQDGLKLWTTDGTVEGNKPLDFDSPFSAVLFGAEIDGLTIFGVRELDPAPSPPPTGSEPLRLYRSDGTVAGTRPVAGVGDLRIVPSGFFTQLGGKVVFNGSQASTGRELWVTDGTGAGTKLLAESIPGPGRGTWFRPHRVGQRVIWPLHREDGAHSLFVTDGTSAGTRELVTFTAAPAQTLTNFLPFGTSVLFGGRSDETGLEPWISDGTVEGTRLLADVCPGPCSSILHRLIAAGNYLLLDDGVTGAEPYVTDGTTEGTVRIADVCPGPCSSSADFLQGNGTRLFFVARDGAHGRELYVTDEQGPPVRLTDFVSRSPFSPPNRIALAGNLHGELLFWTARVTEGVELWRSDGTVEGTRPVGTLFRPPLRPAGSYPSGFASLGSELFFAGYDPLDGLLLYRKRGSEPVERLDVLDADPLRTPAFPARTFVAGDLLFIDVEKKSPLDFQLSVSDGTAGSVAALQQGRGAISRAASVAGLLFFYRDFDRELWISDGTPAGTRPWMDGVSSIASAGGVLYFLRDDALWRTDGSSAGTREVFASSALGADELSDLRAHEPFLYLSAASSLGEDSDRIYRSNGTMAGTKPVTPIGVAGSVVGVLKGRIVFLRRVGEEIQVWGSDGTPDSTRRVGTLGRRVIEQVARLGDELWFLNQDHELFRTDGTPEGTRRVVVVPPAGVVLSVHDRTIFRIQAVPGRLLLFLRSGELWETDGTAAGTREIGDLSARGDAHQHGSQMVFAASGDTAGWELWGLNIDPASPPPPRPPNPMTAPTAPRSLRAEGIDSAVRLTWEDTAEDEETFVVEARSWAGTVFERVAVVPQNTTSVDVLSPSVGPAVFRVRAENNVGVSAWSDVASATAIGDLSDHCGFDVHNRDVLCLHDGRFRVAAYWHSERQGRSGVGRELPFDFSDDSGAFWFFDPANIELVVKVLDARVINDSFWVFYGALSNVEYWVVVTDAQEGTNVTYYNPPGNLCGSGDTSAFPRPGAAARLEGGAATAACTPGPDHLCLTEERYRVEVAWRDHRSGDTGAGHAISGTTDSGYFWFFDPANVELVVKVLDASIINSHTWVFFGALTDVEYTLTVTDTLTGEQKTYSNPSGNICGQADVTAF